MRTFPSSESPYLRVVECSHCTWIAVQQSEPDLNILPDNRSVRFLATFSRALHSLARPCKLASQSWSCPRVLNPLLHPLRHSSRLSPRRPWCFHPPPSLDPPFRRCRQLSSLIPPASQSLASP